MTEYVILRHELEDGPAASTTGVWREAGVVKASSPATAIRTLTHTGKNTYLAVPMRSWKPLTVKTEQVTKVTIG